MHTAKEEEEKCYIKDENRIVQCRCTIFSYYYSGDIC